MLFGKGILVFMIYLREEKFQFLWLASGEKEEQETGRQVDRRGSEGNCFRGYFRVLHFGVQFTEPQ